MDLSTIWASTCLGRYPNICFHLHKIKPMSIGPSDFTSGERTYSPGPVVGFSLGFASGIKSPYLQSRLLRPGTRGHHVAAAGRGGGCGALVPGRNTARDSCLFLFFPHFRVISFSISFLFQFGFPVYIISNMFPYAYYTLYYIHSTRWCIYN